MAQVHARTPRSRPLQLTRRSLLIGGAGALLLAACGDDGGTSAGDAGGDGGGGEQDLTGTTLAEGSIVLQPLFNPQTGYLRREREQRLTWGLFDWEGAPYGDGPDELEFELFFQAAGGDGDGETPEEESWGTATATWHDQDLPRGYYEFRFTPDQEGIYRARTVLDDQELSQPFQVSAPEDVQLVQIGGDMIPVATATLDDPLGVDPICTRDPECPFHEISLDQALEAGGPVAFLVSTPAYCQTGICGPVLDLLIEAAENQPDLQVIHTEVYENPTEVENILDATVVPAVTEYGLTFEPSLFLADASGSVVDRLDNIWDSEELGASLDKLA